MSRATVQSCARSLAEASDGLWWISERDDHFRPVAWDDEPGEGFGVQRLLQHLGRPADEPVEVQDLDTFFQRATTDQPWYGPEEREVARRYRHLVELLKSTLRDPRVYRINASDHFDTYVLGAHAGGICGLSTTEVET